MRDHAHDDRNVHHHAEIAADRYGHHRGPQRHVDAGGRDLARRGTVVLTDMNWNTGVVVTVTGLSDGQPAGTVANYTIVTDASDQSRSQLQRVNPS